MLRECLVGFRHCNRYHCHSKIDDALQPFERGVLRRWHASVIQAGTDVFSGVIRTKSDDIVETLNTAKWKPIDLPAAGESCSAYIEIAPKKVKFFSSFRDREDATAYARRRITAADAFESFQLTFVAASELEVLKPGSAYRSPTAWFKVEGVVKSVDRLEHLVLNGVGGSNSFGVGLLNPKGSALYELAEAVAYAHA